MENKVMKQLMILIGFAVVLSGLAGCHNPSESVEVIIEDDGEFPEFLVGKWRAIDWPERRWEFVFEKDGTISSAIIPMAWPRMIPGQTNIVPLRNNGKGIFKPGIWTVQYSPETRELIVEIPFDFISMEIGDGRLEGKRNDIFIGQISDNGEIWSADLFSYPDFIAYTEVERPIRADEDAAFMGMIVFEKVQE